MRHRVSALVCALLTIAVAPAAADTITIDQAHAVVDRELELVTKDYVFPEKRDAIVAAIRAKKAAGEYDITNPSDLADKLGSDMMAASHDKHMWVQYDPAQFQAASAPAADPHAAEYFERLAERSNYGYEMLRILPGNIRYLNLTTFNWESKTTPEAVADAARFLSGGDAVIIDLRQNGGGSPQAVRVLISYFMPAKKQLLMSYHDGISGTTDTSYVDLKLAAPRMVGKPLYVLTSSGTGSAAEEFAYHIKMFKLGTLVGDTTGGAANNNTVFPLASGLLGSISTGRAIHPVDNGNWEGTGVAPDVAVAADSALDQAQLLALQKLASAPGSDKDATAWAITGLTARLSPHARLDDAAMAAYAGTYGIRTVTFKDGALLYQRESRAIRSLTRLGDDLFTIGDTDDTRIRFRRKDGKITGFDMLTVDGQTIPIERTR